MKFTRKFLDGYVTYDEDDAIVHANSFFWLYFQIYSSINTWNNTWSHIYNYTWFLGIYWILRYCVARLSYFLINLSS